MKEYVVIYEWTGQNYSAYVPDLPGCVAAGGTLEETERLINEAIKLYTEELYSAGQTLPEPKTKAKCIALKV
jgi:predicted RNase H-like HicB family nuclease